MIIARHVKHVKCNNTFARVAYNIFSTIEQKNNDKQQFSPVRRALFFARS
jgi:hypothetical protein